MNDEERKRYEVESDPIWERLLMRGCTGYDAMEKVEALGYWVISSWGQDGWDLGSWPYVMVFFRNPPRTPDGTYDVVEYCEGDATTYRCPDRATRERLVDGIAFWHWQHQGEEWVNGIETIDQVPADSPLRGPYRPTSIPLNPVLENDPGAERDTQRHDDEEKKEGWPL